MPPGFGVSGDVEALEQLRGRLRAETSDGLALLHSPEDNPICSISIDDSLPGIVVTWKRYATSTQLRYVQEHLLQLLRTHGVGKILGDDSALATIHPDDQVWIVNDWMPRAMAAGLRACAGKVSNFYFGKLSTDRIRSEAPQGLVIRMFDTLADARQWLREFNPG